MGTIIIPIHGVICIIKELALIPWAEWAANGVLEHLKNIGQSIILIPAWLFVLWILHSLAMFGIHRLWPNDYDEHGHRRK